MNYNLQQYFRLLFKSVLTLMAVAAPALVLNVTTLGSETTLAAEQGLAPSAQGAAEFSASEKVDDLDLWSVDPMIKVFRDAKLESNTFDTIDTARGEHVSLQVVFRSSRPVSGLKARLSQPLTLEGDGNRSALADARLRFVGYVPVNRPTQWRDSDQLRATPADYPDPLLADESIDLVEGHAQPIWVTLQIPTRSTPGVYQGEVEVSGSAEGDQFVGRLPIAIRVYDVTVGPSRMWSSCWFSAQMKKMGVDAAAFSPEYWSLMRKFARNLEEHRQNVVKLSPQKLGEFSIADSGELQIDFARFDRTVQMFIDEGVIGRIEGEPIGRRVSGWNTPFVVHIRKVVDGKVVEDTATPDSPEAEAYCRWYLTTLAEHLQEKGWTDIYMQHLGDEPTEKTLESYYQLSQLARKYAPGVKIIEATHTSALPQDAIDVWMPLLSTLEENYEGFKKQIDAGSEVWTYACLHPQGGWANRFMEQPLLKTRFLSWINFRYGIAGHLNWGYNSWRSEDPFTQTTPKGGPGYLPAGDAWMVYPSDDGPLDSIRYEAWRDGSADHELLSMLAETEPEAAQRIVARHILSFKKYNIDVEAFRASRREMLELLEGAGE